MTKRKAAPAALNTTGPAPTLPQRIRYFVGQLMQVAAQPGPDGEVDLELGGLAVALDMVAGDAERELAALTLQRDLAAAHDQQPYPTAWAYDQACKAARKHHDRAEAAEAAIARVRALAEGDYYGITGRAFLAALDGPTPDPDDDTPLAACRVMETRTCPASYAGPCGDRPCARFESDDPTPWTGDDLPPEPTTSNITDWATSIDEQCPARYRGDSPHLSRPSGESVDYRCGRRGHSLGTDHATRQDHAGLVFCWTDAIAVYPTTGSES